MSKQAPTRPLALLRRAGGTALRAVLIQSKAGVPLVEISLSVTKASTGEKFPVTGQRVCIRTEELPAVIAALGEAQTILGTNA